MTQLISVLLAAGGASRFGGAKQLAKVNDAMPMLELTLKRLRKITPGHVTLVLGAYCDDILQNFQFETRFPEVSIAVNAHWQRGMGSSIACAMPYAKDYDGVLIHLADHVAVRSSQLLGLRDTWQKNPDHIVAAQYNDTLGAPAIFPKPYFDALAKLDGDRGARTIIANATASVTPFPLPEAKWDIDTRQNLRAWQRNHVDGVF